MPRVRVYTAEQIARRSAYQREWYKRNREAVLEYNQRPERLEAKEASRQRNVASSRVRAVARKFGLSPGEYLQLLADHPTCNICDRTAEQAHSGRALSVDHDHETGQIRGMLCASCNLGIGQLGDDPARVESALRYLRRWKDAG